MVSTLSSWRISLVGLVVALLSLSAVHAEDSKAAASKVSYYNQIRPLLQANCQGCHQPAKPQGSYWMTSFDKLLAGGESETAAIVPGKPGESYLLDLITPEDGEAEMPKGKKPLAESDIGLIRKWIEQGATDDTPKSARKRFDREHPPVYTLPPVITSLDYSPDGTLLAVSGFHEVLLHKADGSGLVDRLIGVSERIESVQFSPDGKLLAVTGGMPALMGEVQIWDVAKRELKLSVPVTYDTVYGASWSPDGKFIAFGCSDNTVRAIDAASGKQVLYQGSHSDWVLDTVFSADGSHVISVSRDRSTKLTEFKTQRFIDNITSITPGALKGGIGSVARHPKADAILVGGADGVPKLYRIFRQSKRVIGDDANLIRKFPPLAGRIISVAVSRDGSHIAAGSSLNGVGQVRIYSYNFEVKPPADIAKIVAKRSAQRSADERKALAQYQVKGVRVVGEATIPQGGIYSVAFDPAGKTLATGGADGTIRLFSTEGSGLVKEFVPVPLETARNAAEVTAKLVGRPDRSPPEKETLNAADKLVSLEVQPRDVKISRKFEAIQFIVTGRLQNGNAIDVTRMVDIKSTSNRVEISPRGRLHATANGQTQITFSLEGKSATATVVATGLDAEYHPSFIPDVSPAISRMGCNAGTCHGANKGKSGLKLSLRGNDAIVDVRAFSDDLASRRVNMASPPDSLILLKATASVPHQGGRVTGPGEPYYEIVRKWIADGAHLDLDSPRVDSIDIFPKNPIVQRVDEKQQFRIVATYSNGVVRDVTAEAFIQGGATDIVIADSAGLIAALRRGESPVLARFEGRYAATTLTVMGNRTNFVWKQLPTNNFIDELIDDKLRRTKTLPSNLCTDAEFIRRISLDLLGLPPSSADVRKFMADKRNSRQKRDELIDKLIGSDDYIEHWTNKWADLLQVNRKYLGPEGSKLFRDWIRNAVAENSPYDEFVYGILTATGSNRENPPASYYKIHRNPQDTMENTTHLFLGVRFSCNKCHDHPFERWSQDQYYETAAYFARIGLKKDPVSGKKEIGRTAVEKGKPLYEIVFDQDKGEVTHERTGRIAAPKFPYDSHYEVPATASRRTHLAKWITSQDNRYFAKSYVNRMWGYLLGAGFIEPLDDIRAGNPPTNPELLNRLTEKFIADGFDVRRLVETICKSRTYQLSVASNTWNEDDNINYSHAMARRLPAEVLYDTLHRAIGSISKIPGVPAGTRAAQLPDAGVTLPSGFLAQFGRPARESACECERSSGMQLGPVMALCSGPTVGNAIGDPKNAIAKLVASQKNDSEVVKELFLRVLNRPATKDEIVLGTQMINGIPREHEQLVAELKAYEKNLQPVIVKREKIRKDVIAQATGELKNYEKQIAPREAKLDQQQKERTAKLEAVLKGYEKTLAGKLTAWEARKDRETKWIPLDPKGLSATSATTLVRQKDLSVLARSSNGLGAYKVVTETGLSGITAIRLEALTDKTLPKKGPGRSSDGNFVLSEFEVTAAPKSDPKKAKKVQLENAQADFSQSGYAVATAIDGKVLRAGNGWAIASQQGKNHMASFETTGAVGHEGGTILTFTLKQQFQSGQHSLGRFRISVTTSPGPILLDGIPETVKKVLAVASDKRTDKQKSELLKYYSGFDKELNKHRTAVAASKKPRPIDPKLKTLRNTLAETNKPLPIDPRLSQLRQDVEESHRQLASQRLTGAQDIAWALINSPAFLFNR